MATISILIPVKDGQIRETMSAVKEELFRLSKCTIQDVRYVMNQREILLYICSTWEQRSEAIVSICALTVGRGRVSVSVISPQEHVE